MNPVNFHPPSSNFIFYDVPVRLTTSTVDCSFPPANVGYFEWSSPPFMPLPARQAHRPCRSQTPSTESASQCALGCTSSSSSPPHLDARCTNTVQEDTAHVGFHRTKDMLDPCMNARFLCVAQRLCFGLWFVAIGTFMNPALVLASLETFLLFVREPVKKSKNISHL